MATSRVLSDYRALCEFSSQVGLGGLRCAAEGSVNPKAHESRSEDDKHARELALNRNESDARDIHIETKKIENFKFILKVIHDLTKYRLKRIKFYKRIFLLYFIIYFRGYG